jgi:hypothetical protein
MILIISGVELITIIYASSVPTSQRTHRFVITSTRAYMKTITPCGQIFTFNIIYSMLCDFIYTNSGPGSSVGVATDYGLDGPGSNPGGGEIFRPSRQALGPTQSPVKRVPDLSRGVKCGRGVLLTTHPLLVPRSWKSRAISLPTLWATPGL